MCCAFRQHGGHVQVNVAEIVLWDFPLLEKENVTLIPKTNGDEKENNQENNKTKNLDARL